MRGWGEGRISGDAMDEREDPTSSFSGLVSRKFPEHVKFPEHRCEIEKDEDSIEKN